MQISRTVVIAYAVFALAAGGTASLAQAEQVEGNVQNDDIDYTGRILVITQAPFSGFGGAAPRRWSRVRARRTTV